MVKFLPSSVKWLVFTLLSSLISYYFTGLSNITLSSFITGFIFSVGYLYRNNL
ncbi:hypothetical protein FB550_11821 [Neobacillus bataviensis]|uniref:Uncharacterized protein n=1 Tax=Neobacillus bataviensis TaxID=220685 RepID=A0A561CMZ3_9BACI|nr:hypothetical protein FB550_11821 [Neobacillus bataviensis]